MENLLDKSKELISLLQKQQKEFVSVISSNLLVKLPFIFDLTEKNQELSRLNLHDQSVFTDYVFATMKEQQAKLGIGKYNEDRIIYRRSELFSQEAEPRSVHLGIDLWVPVGTEIFAPLDGVVHSFQDNNSFGDYGPTIILEHNLDGLTFYTLYGHLSRESLSGLYVGKRIEKGFNFAWVGKYDVNGNWPEHLHFQVIADILGKFGDFPGVCRPSERSYYLDLCPDPNLILNL